MDSTSMLGRLGTAIMSPFRLFSPKPKTPGSQAVREVSKMGALSDSDVRKSGRSRTPAKKLGEKAKSPAKSAGKKTPAKSAAKKTPAKKEAAPKKTPAKKEAAPKKTPAKKEAAPKKTPAKKTPAKPKAETKSTGKKRTGQCSHAPALGCVALGCCGAPDSSWCPLVQLHFVTPDNQQLTEAHKLCAASAAKIEAKPAKKAKTAKAAPDARVSTRRSSRRCDPD
eukprot:scaffold317_cov379-Prasinococcus_capsulatus_cf.AAC.4